MKTEIILNLKGGVAKTATAVNVAAILARDYNQRVLLIDADSQCNATEFYGGDPGKGNLAELLRRGNAEDAAWGIQSTRFRGVDLLAGDESLMDLDLTKVELQDVKTAVLRDMVSMLTGMKLYDWVLVDCPPAFNAASAAALLARLKVIRDKLDKPFVKLYEKNTIPESVAYALAQQPVEIQRAVYDYKCCGKNGAKYLREYSVDEVAKTYKAIVNQKCRHGGTCINSAAMLSKIYDDTYSYKYCEHRTCCDKCEKLASCRSACPKLAEKVKQLKADNKAARQQEQLAKAEKERPDIEQITELWARFGEARRRAHQSVRKCMEAARMMYGTSDDQKYSSLENARCKISPHTTLPYGYSFYLADARNLIAVADCLGCSLDYLLCRTDDPKAETPQETADVPCWNSGDPEKKGHYYVRLDCDGLDLEDDLWFDPAVGWYEPAHGKFELGEVHGWIRLPED